MKSITIPKEVTKEEDFVVLPQLGQNRQLLDELDTDEAIKIWVALEAIPDWIVAVQLSMIAFIWAAKPLANLGAGLIQKGKK